jgi:hypothetical protein
VNTHNNVVSGAAITPCDHVKVKVKSARARCQTQTHASCATSTSGTNTNTRQHRIIAPSSAEVYMRANTDTDDDTGAPTTIKKHVINPYAKTPPPSTQQQHQHRAISTAAGNYSRSSSSSSTPVMIRNPYAKKASLPSPSTSPSMTIESGSSSPISKPRTRATLSPHRPIIKETIQKNRTKRSDGDEPATMFSNRTEADHVHFYVDVDASVNHTIDQDQPQSNHNNGNNSLPADKSSLSVPADADNIHITLTLDPSKARPPVRIMSFTSRNTPAHMRQRLPVNVVVLMGGGNNKPKNVPEAEAVASSLFKFGEFNTVQSEMAQALMTTPDNIAPVKHVCLKWPWSI